MNVLLIPIGTLGDIHPYVGLGVALQARGHCVTVLARQRYETLIRRVGLQYVAFGDQENLRRPCKKPRLSVQGLSRISIVRHSYFQACFYLPLVRRLYAIIETLHVPAKTVVIASTWALGARVAHEILGVPMGTISLHPDQFRSIYRDSLNPLGRYLPRWAARLWRKFFNWTSDVLVRDRIFGPEINAFRAELGLPPIRRLFQDWWRSPQRVIGLFPEWFAPPQPDWPPQTRLTGFPLFDESTLQEPPAELQAFLDQGDPPIVFTNGSYPYLGKWFFREAVGTCRRLSRRGVFLTGFREQLPARLPDFVLHVDYVPLSQVLPRSAAVVHHGGIGTSALALAAGMPQLIVPTHGDQPDNAARLERLGVSHTINARRFHGNLAASSLERLLCSSNVRSQCGLLSRRIREDHPLEKTCQLIEELL